jgi:beta-glucosidase/6-phospho-beta-glucosidase/beta-galactosidase
MDQTTAPPPPSLFNSFFLGGFECSSHRRKDGRRLDLLASTEHDARAANDYRLAARHGIRTVRDGLRWHLIEANPLSYDFSSFLPMLRAARDTQTQVIWDLMHYGWPDRIDIWKPSFIDRFADYARAAAKVVKAETDDVPFYTPINEISFWAWGGGDAEYLNPFAKGRGGELKRILVRAAIAAIDAVREIDPRARIVSAEPLIYIFPKSGAPDDVRQAAAYNEVQFEAMDLLSGRLEPELGGRPDLLDIVGVNFYYNNQWVDHGRTVFLGDGMNRPLGELLAGAYHRYERPFFIAETGTESAGRAPWLHYVCDEVADARANGVPVEGVCLYPILNYPGWDDDRPCQNGLFGGVSRDGERTVDKRLASELKRQQALLADPSTRYG